MAQAGAGLHWKVIPSTSDAAPGLLASVAHPLGAPHSPALCHGQPALRKALAAPLAAQQRAAAKAVVKAEETLKRRQEHRSSANNAPGKRGPGRPPTGAASIEQGAQAGEALAQSTTASPSRARRSPRACALSATRTPLST